VNRIEFIQQVVLTTLAHYMVGTKEVHVDYSNVLRKVPLSEDEAQDECIRAAKKLADKLGLS